MWERLKAPTMSWQKEGQYKKQCRKDGQRISSLDNGVRELMCLMMGFVSINRRRTTLKNVTGLESYCGSSSGM